MKWEGQGNHGIACWIRSCWVLVLCCSGVKDHNICGPLSYCFCRGHLGPVFSAPKFGREHETGVHNGPVWFFLTMLVMVGVGVVVVVKIMITMMIMRIGEDHEAGVLTRDQFGDSEIRNCVTEHFKVQIWRFSQQVDPQRISIRSSSSSSISSSSSFSSSSCQQIHLLSACWPRFSDGHNTDLGASLAITMITVLAYEDDVYL